jgi:hypothetical protein
MKRDRFGDAIEAAEDADLVSSWLEQHPERRAELEHNARELLGLRVGGEHGSRTASLALQMSVARLARRAMLTEITTARLGAGADD